MRALLILLALAVASPAHADVLKVGEKYAELDVAVDAAGKAVKLKAYKDKWVLVTVGAAWCKPCKKELPVWDKLAASYKGKITFMAVDVDDEIADGKKFHKKLKLKNMKLVYMPAASSSAAGRYGAETMPTTFVIDPKGVVRHVHAGFNESDPSGETKKLQATLDKLLKP
jgi:thiol-disulfide isomerase/thioredoxin